MEKNENKNLTGYPSVDKPWLKYYSEDLINTPLPSATIYEHMYQQNRDYPQDIAISYLGREISYKNLFQNIENAAKAFITAGVKCGDIVTVALPSVPEALYSLYALNKIGAVANMIHPLAGQTDLIFDLRESGSKVVVLFDVTYESLRDVLSRTNVRLAVVVSAGDSLPFGLKQLYFLKNPRKSLPKDGSAVLWQSFIQAGEKTPIPQIRKDPETMAVISHTGGTTGSPKGVMCSDNSINAMIVMTGQILSPVRQERAMAVLPPFINYSLVNSMLEPIAFGVTCVLIPKYEPERFFEYMKKYKPNYIVSIPPYWEALLQLPEPASLDLSCLKVGIYGGESMAKQNETAINEFLLSHGAKNRLSTGLGMTEVICAATLTSFEHDMTGSVGIPLPQVTCKIVVPEEETECSYGQDGEICYGGPTLMIGYYHNQQATDDVVKVHKDGIRWIHSGDLGHIDENGILYITGRIKRIVMTKGKDGNITKLFPVRIEEAINSHPAVRVSCVIGIKDEERVNYPRAIIELNDNFTASEELSEEIMEHCRRHLPDYSLPDEIVFRETLPRTPRGKVDYRALEKEVLLSEG